MKSQEKRFFVAAPSHLGNAIDPGREQTGGSKEHQGLALGRQEEGSVLLLHKPVTTTRHEVPYARAGRMRRTSLVLRSGRCNRLLARPNQAGLFLFDGVPFCACLVGCRIIEFLRGGLSTPFKKGEGGEGGIKIGTEACLSLRG